MKSLQVCLLLAAATFALPWAANAEEPTSSLSNNAYSQAVPSDQETVRMSADGTMYLVSYDFSKGREYWLSPYPNHPNYGIRYVYLIDQQGKRIQPELYVELADGRLELATLARNRSTNQIQATR